eukprot:1987526-Rhodomonas_salina.1
MLFLLFAVPRARSQYKTCAGSQYHDKDVSTNSAPVRSTVRGPASVKAVRSLYRQTTTQNLAENA